MPLQPAAIQFLVSPVFAGAFLVSSGFCLPLGLFPSACRGFPPSVLFLVRFGCVAATCFFAFFILPSFLAQPSLSLRSSSCASSWIMLKVVSFTTTWLGLSCISTIWRGSYLFSSHLLNMKNLCLQRIYAWNVPPPGAYILLSPSHHRNLHQLWCHMEAFRPIW